MSSTMRSREQAVAIPTNPLFNFEPERLRGPCYLRRGEIQKAPYFCAADSDRTDVTVGVCHGVEASIVQAEVVEPSWAV